MDTLNMATRENPTGWKVLTLDGGGVRGLVSLLILKRLMYTYKPSDDDYKLPKPCEVFDFIVGTSTGGLIAIMLGRLRMDVQSCIDCYKVLAHDVFQERKRTKIGGTLIHNVLGTATFSSTNLKEAISTILSKARPPLNDSTALIEDRESCRCRVFVCTTMKNLRALRLRNYSLTTEDAVRCTILEAATATSAAPTFFDPVKIKDVGVTLYDGALKHNNPVEEVVSEIDAEFRDKSIGCLVSIGTGVSKDENLGRSLITVAKACGKIAVDTEDSHYRFKLRECSDGGRLRDKYFRFNVDQGLQGVGLAEWDAMDDMWAVTRTYMDRQKEAALECVRCLTNLDETNTTEHENFPSAISSATRFTTVPESFEDNVDGSSSKNLSIVLRPKDQVFGDSDPPISNLDNYGLSPVNFFCQREELVQKICKTFDKTRKSNRAVCCLRGIGGSGKTQLALWYAKTHHCRKYNTLLWFDANSPQRLAECFSFTTKFLGVVPSTSATSRSTGYKAVSKRWEVDYVIALKEWLNRRRGRYLLVFDNSDTDEMIDLLPRFFPDTNNGDVLITSRRDRVYVLGGTVLVEGLAPESAVDLLLYHAGIEAPSETQRALGQKVVFEMGYLALAVDLAGVFIRTLGGDIKCYSHMYAESKDRVNKMALDENRNAALSSYPYSVFTAWDVSKNSLSPPAQNLLHLFSFFHREYINLDIFRRCCETRVRWKVDGELKYITPAESGVPDWLLAAVTTDDGIYDQYKLTKLVSEICSFSFASTEFIVGPRLYHYDQAQLFELGVKIETTIVNMHPLLHEISRLYLDAQQQESFAKQAECILWHSIDDDANKPWRERDQEYFPVLHSGGGATTNIPLFIFQLDEVSRHLQSVMISVFNEHRDIISDTGHLKSYYLCLLLLFLLRACDARTLKEFREKFSSSYSIFESLLKSELNRLGLLRRQDLTTQWLRLASRQYRMIFRFCHDNNERSLMKDYLAIWNYAIDCELQSYSSYLKTKTATKALTLTEADNEQVLNIQDAVKRIQGSQLNKQIMLGVQNLDYTTMKSAR